MKTDRTPTNCKICASATAPFCTALVLSRYRVQYFRCMACGFVQTEDPYWLGQAYSSALSPLDIGLVARNLEIAPIIEMLIRFFFKSESRFLDFGGGSGLLVRLMRDRGLDFRWYDAHATNLFARGFEGVLEKERYELVAALEVLEHLVDPLVDIERMFSASENLFLSTMPLPPSTPKPGEWWYYAPEGGQHISLYTQQSLAIIANRFGVKLYSKGMYHLLTRKDISPFFFRMICRSHEARLLRFFSRRESLAEKDRATILAKITGDSKQEALAHQRREHL